MTVEEALRRSLARAGQGEVTFPRDFHGFPGTVHGGAVAALFYRATTPRPPVRLRMELVRSVPTETPLRLVTGSAGSLARLELSQDDRRLASAELAREGLPLLDPDPALAAWRERDIGAAELPGTASCLACGSANPLGLGIRFRADDRLLWQEYRPPETYRAADGWLHPAAATILLDEVGWWLGALQQQECGVTTEVAITIVRRMPFAPLLVLGERTTAQPDDDPRGRYIRAHGWLLTADRVLLAAGTVRFAGSAAYTRRLLQPFLETTDPALLFRLFPNARALAHRGSRNGPRSM